MKSSNPIFRKMENSQEYAIEKTGATFFGISIKTLILFIAAIVAAAFAMSLIKEENYEPVIMIIGVSGITAFISVMIASFIPRVAMPFSILYSLAQGFTLGAITIIVDMSFPGQHIGVSAITATLVIFGVMLFVYSARIFRVTTKFRKFMISILLGILLFSIISMIFPNIYGNIFAGNGVVAIVVSVLLIVYGAFMLLLDFDRAEAIVSSGSDKKYEWVVALGMMVTLVWIYVEVLRLLVIIAGKKE